MRFQTPQVGTRIQTNKNKYLRKDTELTQKRFTLKNVKIYYENVDISLKNLGCLEEKLMSIKREKKNRHGTYYNLCLTALTGTDWLIFISSQLFYFINLFCPEKKRSHCKKELNGLTIRINQTLYTFDISRCGLQQI